MKKAEAKRVDFSYKIILGLFVILAIVGFYLAGYFGGRSANCYYTNEIYGNQKW